MDFSFIFCQNYFQLEVYKLHACIRSFCPIKSVIYYIGIYRCNGCAFSKVHEFNLMKNIWFGTKVPHNILYLLKRLCFHPPGFFLLHQVSNNVNLGIVVNSIPRRIFFKLIYRHLIHLSVALNESDFSTWRICGIIFWSEKSRYSWRKYFSKPRLTYRVFV